MSLRENTCLQCEQSREAVRRNRYFCATVSGYWVVETDEEWDQHHWRDWSDAELRRLKIEPSLWNANRRTPWRDLEFAILESICMRNGHIEPDLEMSGPDHCPRCWLNLRTQREAGQEVRIQEDAR